MLIGFGRNIHRKISIALFAVSVGELRPRRRLLFFIVPWRIINIISGKYGTDILDFNEFKLIVPLLELVNLLRIFSLNLLCVTDLCLYFALFPL